MHALVVDSAGAGVAAELRKSLTENDYIDFIKSHIFSQPEFAFALAGENEKKYLLTSAVPVSYTHLTLPTKRIV